jgi:adenylyltransferase/sulfurtransferase
LQALEAIKLITSIGQPLRGRLLTYNALDQNFQTLQLARNPTCPLCGNTPTIRAISEPRDIAASDASTTSSPSMSETDFPIEVSVTEARRRRETAPERTAIIDVRESYELDICRLDDAEHIPMRQIPERLETLARDKHLMILCHTGVRSMRVTEFLRARGLAAVSNIAGGIDAWAEEIEPGMQRY